MTEEIRVDTAKTCGTCQHCGWSDEYSALCAFNEEPDVRDSTFASECLVYAERTDSVEQTCTMTKNDIAWPVFGEYTWECNVCSESTALLACVNENGDADYIKPKFCASCGLKVVNE